MILSVMSEKEEQSLAARRLREAERLKRIKDPVAYAKVDTAALEVQIADKASKKEAEKEVRRQYDEERLLMEQQLAYLEQERLRAERQKMKDMDAFRATFQGQTLAREYDLYNPSKLKSEQPARVGDDDPRLGVSGCQLFGGEDLGYAARVKAQRDQQKAWNDELVAQKEAKAQAERDEERAYANSLLEMDDMKKTLEATATSARSSTNKAVAAYQLAQVDAKRERERAQQIAELEDSISEVQSALSGGFLNEDPAAGQSATCAHRVRPDHYKGMPREGQVAILNQQAAQRDDAAAALARSKAEKASSDAELEHMRKVGCYTEAMVAQSRAEQRKALMEQNQQLAREQSAAKSFLETQVFPNQMDEGFFQQFNTTSR